MEGSHQPDHAFTWTDHQSQDVTKSHFVTGNDDSPTDHPSPDHFFYSIRLLRFPIFSCCPIYHHQDISLLAATVPCNPINFTSLYTKSSEIVSSQMIVGLLVGSSRRFSFICSRRYPINCKMMLLVISRTDIPTMWLVFVKASSNDSATTVIQHLVPFPVPDKLDSAQAGLKKLSFHSIPTVTPS